MSYEEIAGETPEFRAIELAHSLSRIADIVRENPAHIDVWENYFRHLSWFAYDEATMKQFVGALTPYARRTLAGDRGLTKKWSEHYLRVTGYLGNIEVSMVAGRETVCERRVVGTREVKKMVPSPDAALVEVTEKEDVVEWHCGSLLKEDDES